ncbi:MAG: UDP-N-acetylenolpyruvoylglucosamine reductase [Desulfobulbaceae bacterium A2]|nr:MAG: UDP-N-acetylenolpyruvoylglucosamine reductase [Desulfobulbaceae bacterium A2]
MTRGWQEELAAWWPTESQWNVSMADYSSLRAGGTATAFIQVEQPEHLVALIPWLEERRVSWRVIGRGSNILVRQQGFAGVLLRLGPAFGRIALKITDEGPAMLQVGAACALGRLVGWTVRRGLAGLEFAIGIPGSVGGAVRMNAGAWGGAMGDCLAGVSLLDRQGELHEVPRAELTPGYRCLQGPGIDDGAGIIVGACFALGQERVELLQQRCREYRQRRRLHQPRGVASAGSFFKNPVGDSAGRLIEAAGLKGLRRGDAMISQRHANFLVNAGEASAADIVALMGVVQERVQDAFGVRLEPEVHLL